MKKNTLILSSLAALLTLAGTASAHGRHDRWESRGRERYERRERVVEVVRYEPRQEERYERREPVVYYQREAPRCEAPAIIIRTPGVHLNVGVTF